jgi:hypothetical protein
MNSTSADALHGRSPAPFVPARRGLDDAFETKTYRIVRIRENPLRIRLLRFPGEVSQPSLETGAECSCFDLAMDNGIDIFDLVEGELTLKDAIQADRMRLRATPPLGTDSRL